MNKEIPKGNNKIVISNFKNFIKQYFINFIFNFDSIFRLNCSIDRKQFLDIMVFSITLIPSG